jgi:hypothetical protein
MSGSPDTSFGYCATLRLHFSRKAFVTDELLDVIR